MADSLTLPDPDLAALALGRTVVAFIPRHAVDLNDELELEAGGPRPSEQLSRANQDLLGLGPPDGPLVGLVVGLQPAASLGGPNGSPHHVLNSVPEGDVAILRVFDGAEPALSDDEFEARRAAVEAMFQ